MAVSVSEEAERKLRELLSGRKLQIRLEILDRETGDVVYGFRVSDDARVGDRLVIRHQIGDFAISNSGNS